MPEASIDRAPIARTERLSLLVPTVAGAAAAVLSLVHLVVRLIEIAPNRDVPVRVPADGIAVQLPMGPDGSSVSAFADEATVAVSGMAGITIASLVLAAVITTLMTIAIVGCVAFFCVNLMRSRVFVPSNGRAIFIAVVSLAVGTALSSLFSVMGANGALAALSDYSYDATTIASVDFTPWFASVAIGVFGVAFQVGTKLQRDTEGLV